MAECISVTILVEGYLVLEPARLEEKRLNQV